MSDAIAIELNDTGILVCDANRILSNSPGYLVETDKHLWTGMEARNRAQLLSGHCDTRFWMELARAASGSINRHAGARVYCHLQEIWSQAPSDIDTVILTIPANFTRTGLGLLLGVCKELAIPVRAMVQHAVLMPRQAGHDGPIAHVEMQLHHTHVSFLQEDDSEFSIQHVEALHDVGLLSLLAEASTIIAQAFVAQTRFDPLHSASSEQQLYLELANWLTLAHQQELVHGYIDHGQQRFEADIATSGLRQLCRSYVGQMIDAAGSADPEGQPTVCITESVNRLLDFTKYANSRGIATRVLPKGYHAQNSLQRIEQLIEPDARIYLIKQLACYTVNDSPVAPCDLSINSEDVPTHVLYLNRAYEIDSNLSVVTQEDDEKLCLLTTTQPDSDSNVLVTLRKETSELLIRCAGDVSVLLNGLPLKGRVRIAIGDKMSIDHGRCELTFITVVS